MGVTYSLEKRKTIASWRRSIISSWLRILLIAACDMSGDIPTLSSFVPPELSVRMTSYSKTLAPGLRMGVMMETRRLSNG